MSFMINSATCGRMSNMYTEQPIDEYNESLDKGTELKAHKRLRRIMRITQEIEQEENKEDEHII